MGEHLLAGKLICGDACRADRFCISSIRVCLPQKYVRQAEDERACAFWKTNFQRRVQGWRLSHSRHSGVARVGLTDFAVLSFVYKSWGDGGEPPC